VYPGILSAICFPENPSLTSASSFSVSASGQNRLPIAQVLLDLIDVADRSTPVAKGWLAIAKTPPLPCGAVNLGALGQDGSDIVPFQAEFHEIILDLAD
jgi:hypothetical protein